LPLSRCFHANHDDKEELALSRTVWLWIYVLREEIRLYNCLAFKALHSFCLKVNQLKGGEQEGLRQEGLGDLGKH
jgi:hypothetical protein